MEQRVLRVVGGLFFVALCLLVVTSSGCSESIPLGGQDSTSDAEPPLISNDGGYTPDANAFTALCKATECPAPYGSCSTDAFRCETNFDTDSDNCGACGVVCPRGYEILDYFRAEWTCQAGKCRMVCDQDPRNRVADCNGDVSDGCETDIQCDPNNCGGCGIKCAEGLSCKEGNCGCPSGLVDCGKDECRVGESCIQLESNDSNCGQCGKACDFNSEIPYPHMYYGCVASECGKPKCDTSWADCNDKLDPDGCEAYLFKDPENCGACGRKCAPGQFCETGKCKCTPEETLCTVHDYSYCANLDTDPGNCGMCGRYCPSPDDGSALPVCRLGHCELACPRGYADCDGRISNGCETMISADPRNCGGCGVQCDLTIGQPCVNGACLVAPCEPGETK